MNLMTFLTMSEINLQKLEKLWNHATKNANVHEASTAALMFTKMIAKHKLKVHLYSGQSPATEQQIKEAIDKAYIKAIAIDNLYSFESKLFSFSRRGLDKNEKNP